MMNRTPKQSRGRTRLAPSFQPTVPALAWTATIVATKARLSLNLPFALSGIPVTITNDGEPCTAITPIDAITIDLEFTTAVVPTDVLSVPAGVPEVRGAAGGTLAAGDFTFP